MSPRARKIAHGELELALHELRSTSRSGAPADATPLVLVHALEGSARDWLPHGEAILAAWRGPVFAIDLAGHGESDWRVGGAYTPELFAADVDAVLAAIGRAALAGAGVGAYASLLVAAARRDLVPGAVLLPGRGLAGGGALPVASGRAPDFAPEVARDTRGGSSAQLASRAACDPLVRACLEDVRPVDYAESFAGAARALLLAADGDDLPPWWRAVRGAPPAKAAPREAAAAVAALAEAIA
ncbi:MAG TPA: alpha/beta hydrolase [Candidatus Binatia bacterium]|nr:alpha/beta hydrolase [Candidatus Binatia bacterium]